MEPQVKLRLIPYNARLLDARKGNGWTQKDMCGLTGVSTSYLGHIETLRVIPTEYVMDEISAALNLPKDYLFPETLLAAQRDGLFDHRVAELEEQQIIRLAEGRRAGLLPPHVTDDEMIEQAERAILKKKVAEAIRGSRLSPREQKIITLRFGLKDGVCLSQKEVGFVLNITGGRVQQIEEKALRRLRHPRTSRKLKDLLE